MLLCGDVLHRLNESELRALRGQLIGHLRLVEHQLETIAAIRRVEERLKIPFKDEIRRAKKVMEIIRVMQLARLGHDNETIGDQLGMHPGSVSRIIQRELRAAKFTEDQARDHVPDDCDPERWRIHVLETRYRVRNSLG